MSDKPRWVSFMAVLCLFVAGCGGGDESSNDSLGGGNGPGVGSGGSGGGPSSYTVAGVISGLDAPGLVLANDTETISPPANASVFEFPTSIPTGASYSVTVQTQPVGTTCTVSNGAMTSGTATNVQVACTPRQYLYSGSRGFLVDFADGALTELPSSPFSLANDLSGGSTGSAVADPFGRFVIAGGKVRWIDPQTGAISGTAWSAVSVPGATKAAIDPSGRFLYVSTLSLSTTQGIHGFSIDRDSGLLAPVAGSPFAAGLQARSVTVERTGKFVYVLNRQNTTTTISAYSIDQVTGFLSPVPGSPFATGVSFSSGGFDPHACDIVANPKGDFIHAYSVDDQWGRVYSYAVNTATGELSGPIQTGPSASSNPTSVCGMLAVHPSGKFLYATTMDGQRLFFTFKVDLTNGTYPSKAADLLTHTYAVGDALYHESTFPAGIAVDPSGKYLYVTGGNRLARFNIEADAGDVLYIGHAINFPSGGALVAIRPRP